MATWKRNATLALFLPAFLAGSSAFAALNTAVRVAPTASQVRVVLPGQSLLPAGSLSMSPASLLTAPALAPTPSLTVSVPSALAVPAAIRTAVSAAPADAPKLPLAASPAGERTGEILAQLTPEAVSAAPAEGSRDLAGALFSEAQIKKGGSGETLGAESFSVPLAPAVIGGHAAADAPRAPSSSPKRKASFRDHAHHWRLLTQSFWWYMTTNVRNKWAGMDGKSGHRKAWRDAQAKGPVNVSKMREFFAAMRTTGMSGHFYVLGGAAVQDADVMVDMRGAFERYFDNPGIDSAARDSFENFMARAMNYNTAHRSHTYFYKTIRDALLKASVMRPDQLSTFFDGLLQDGTAQETLDFQNKGEQKRVRDAFRAALLSVLDEEDPRDPNRVVAALVLGSFASGAAGPRSDFDVEVITANGSDERVMHFGKRIQEVWAAAGMQDKNPATAHDHAARPTRAYLDLVHSAAYFVVARNASLEAELSRAPGEAPAFTVDRTRDARGRLGVVLQGVVVRGTIWTEELKHFLRKLI